MFIRTFISGALRLIFGVNALLLATATATTIATSSAASADPKVAPLILQPLDHGAALSSAVGPLEARLRLTEAENADLMGVSTGFDFGSFALKAAYDGQLSGLFGAPGAMTASARDALVNLFAESRSLGLSTALGAARLALAAGTDQDAGEIFAGELQVTEAFADLVLQLGASAAGQRVLGASSSFALRPWLRFELGGKVETNMAAADRHTRLTSELALGGDGAFTSGDRLRARLTRNPEGVERLSFGYAAPLGPGRLLLRSETTPEVATYAARAEWSMKF
ncbi:hypothetical protein [Algihabitans albus]|uniref:hypothetical protein n=1 Tax=Algihabitans albus TaxID=2164067 RepID=UPI000E5CDCE4|nr:hypothetical protein [Algihabitans albus]